MSSYFYSKKYVNNKAENDSPINDASDALGQAGYSIGFHHTISGKEVYFKAFLTTFNETYNRIVTGKHHLLGYHFLLYY